MTDFEYTDGATPIDPDEAQGLLLSHITKRGELDRWEQENILEALNWLDKTKPKDIFNEHFVKKLHKRMFGNVWRWAGKFRQSNKNIGVPWIQVPIEIKKLCDDAQLWVEFHKEPSDFIAVRYHHRLVSIHPFANGNGRHARLMTDILLENTLNRPRFTWGGQNLTRVSEVRRKYIAALHSADESEYKPLLKFARS